MNDRHSDPKRTLRSILLSMFGKKQDGKFNRAYERMPFCIIANLNIPERRIELEGLVLEVSRGGVLFREASTYILDRRGIEIEISFEGMKVSGKIVNVTTRGYGIKLDKVLNDDELERLMARAGETLQPSQAMRKNAA